jgi:hypothetical protein
MKRQILTFMAVILSVALTHGQGLENFAGFVGTAGTYTDGNFPGQDGSTWNYFQCRSDMPIVAPSPCLGKGRTPDAEVASGTIQNGCGVLSFNYMQAFSSNVSLDVFVNGLLVGNVTSNGEVSVVKNSGAITVNAPGAFTLSFKQHSSTAGQVTIDDVTWTGYSSAPLPEPTNYPTAFAGAALPYTINLSWVDATGAQVPTAYIILGSNQDNITPPVDGTPIVNDPDLADGTGALNVNLGVQSGSFTNLPSNTPYFFKVFPYTNSGSNINYKTDGTAPSVNITTPNTVTLSSQNFSSFSLAPWIQYNVVGAQIWAIDSIHGIGGSPCAKMSGYAGGNFENEDWLISPPMNFNDYINESMTFQSAYNYAGLVLEVMISNDYDGVSDPTLFNWTPLTATWSPGSWAWTPSGNINLAGISGAEVYVGFRYMSSTTDGSTWELDNILITGDELVGIEDPATAETVKVYPNPASDKVYLTFSNDDRKEVSMLTVLGTPVYSKTTNSGSLTIDLSAISRGVYFIRTYYPATQKTVVTKIIVR